MKNLLSLLLLAVVATLPTEYATAQDLNVVNREELNNFDHAVRRMRLDICFDNFQNYTYWYDSEGHLVQYAHIARSGANRLLSADTVLLSTEGVAMLSRHYEYTNDEAVPVKFDTMLLDSEVFEVPKYNIPAYYYMVPSSRDGKGNWQMATYSYGDRSRYIGRKFEYEGALSAEVQAEFGRIDQQRVALHEAKTKKQEQVAAKAKAEERVLDIATVLGGVYLVCAIFFTLLGFYAMNHWGKVRWWFNSRAQADVVPNKFLHRKLLPAFGAGLLWMVCFLLLTSVGISWATKVAVSSSLVAFMLVLLLFGVSAIPSFIYLKTREAYRSTKIGVRASEWETRYIVIMGAALFFAGIVILALAVIALFFMATGGDDDRGSSNDGDRDEVCGHCAYFYYESGYGYKCGRSSSSRSDVSYGQSACSSFRE